MKLCFITKDSLNNAWQNCLSQIGGKDVVVFGFNGLGLVSYKKELDGETEYFQDLAKLSKQLSCTIISGCDTDTYGVFRHSAVVADRGRILGVSDMAHSLDDSEFVAGGNFRVYDTKSGKIGIIICEDLFFPEVARVLTLCDAEIIICVFKRQEGSMPQIMLRAEAFSNGIAMALCAQNCVSVADIRGKIVVSASNNVVEAEIPIEKDYRLINSRRRGIYREFDSGY